jgi:hypothetical protein
MKEDAVVPSPTVFAEEIEEIVWMKDIPYLEACLSWAEQRGFDPEVIASLIKKSGPLRDKIQAESENLNLLTTKTARLPV